MRDRQNDSSQKRKAKNQSGSEDGHAKSKPGCVGTISAESERTGDESLGTGRNDSQRQDVFTWIGSDFNGGIISQLVKELEQQLAYHEEQALITRQRIEKLKSISENHPENDQ